MHFFSNELHIWTYLVSFKSAEENCIGGKKGWRKKFQEKVQVFYNSKYFFCGASETLSVFITAVFGLFAVNFLKPLILTFSGRILFVMFQ